MYNLKRLYNQNREKIWRFILTAVVMFFIIRWLINMLSDNSNMVVIRQEQPIKENTFNSIIVENNKSALTRQSISNNKDEMVVIDKFIEYCNSKKIQEAYELLSNECKEIQYSDINEFYSKYYKAVFDGKTRDVIINNWYGRIYKIDFTEDFLSTGKYTKENNIQDFITIVNDENKNFKLNINNYIGKSKINKKESAENIDITVIEKDMFMDYEIYTLEIKNNSNYNIVLFNTSIMDECYLTDANNIKYKAATSELSQEYVDVEAKETKNIKIKFLNEFGSSKKIKNMVFSNIMKYKQNGNESIEVMISL